MSKKCVYPKCYSTKDGSKCLAPNSWIMFLRNNGGQGLSRNTISQMFVQWKLENFPQNSSVTQRRQILCNDIASRENAIIQAELNAQAAQAAAAIAEAAAQAAQIAAQELEAAQAAQAAAQVAAQVARDNILLNDLARSRRIALQQASVARASASRVHGINVNIMKSRLKSFHDAKRRGKKRAASIITAASKKRSLLLRSKKNLKILKGFKSKSGRKSSFPRISMSAMSKRAEELTLQRALQEARDLERAQAAAEHANDLKTANSRKEAERAAKRLQKSSERHAKSLERDLQSRISNETPASIAQDASNMAKSASESSSLANIEVNSMKQQQAIKKTSLFLKNGMRKNKTGEEVNIYLKKLKVLHDKMYKRTGFNFENVRLDRIDTQNANMLRLLAGDCSVKDSHLDHFRKKFTEAYSNSGPGWGDSNYLKRLSGEDNCDYLMRTIQTDNTIRLKQLIGSGAQGYVFVGNQQQFGPQVVKVSFLRNIGRNDPNDGRHSKTTFWYGVHIHRQIHAKIKGGIKVPKPRYAVGLSRSRISDGSKKHFYAGVFYMDLVKASDVRSLLKTDRAHEVVKKYAKALRLFHTNRFCHGDAHTENFMEENTKEGKMVVIDLDRSVDMRGMKSSQVKTAIGYDISMAFMSLKHSLISIHPVHTADRDSIWEYWVKLFSESYTTKNKPSEISYMGFRKSIQELSELEERNKGPLFNEFYKVVLEPHMRGTSEYLIRTNRFYKW